MLYGFRDFIQLRDIWRTMNSRRAESVAKHDGKRERVQSCSHQKSREVERMKILDRVALVIGAAGMWLYMASVEQDRWSRAVLSAAIVVLTFVIKKIGDRIAERREEQEEWEEERRNRAFSAWIRTGSLKGR